MKWLISDALIYGNRSKSMQDWNLWKTVQESIKEDYEPTRGEGKTQKDPVLGDGAIVCQK